MTREIVILFSTQSFAGTPARVARIIPKWGEDRVTAAGSREDFTLELRRIV